MSWVGGDIAGLQHMGAAMKRAQPETADIVKALDQKVDDLANDAEWRGESAERFRKIWSADSITVGALNSTVAGAGSHIQALGDTLQKYENTLHESADQYRKQGAQIGPNGEPLPVTVTGDPGKSPAKEALEAARQYKEIYDSTMALAKEAKIQTAASLSEALGYVLPDESGNSSVSPDTWATAADYVRGLYAIPNEKLKNVGDLLKELNEARDNFKATRGPLRDAKAEYAAKGLTLPASSDPALAHSKALSELNQAADDFSRARAPGGVLPGSTWLNVKLGDLPKLAGAGDLAKVLPKELGFLKDIPVLDIAATGFVGAVQAQDDHDRGWSNLRSYATDIGAGALGLAAGTAAVVFAPEEAAVGAVAVVGGGLVMGVGNIAYDAFHEHWSEDVHDHGVVAGIADGIGHSVWGGVKDTGTQIADVSKSVWHSIFD